MGTKCHYKTLLSLFMDGELPEKDSIKVNEHLKTCTACRKEIESLQATDRLLTGMKEIEPSVRFERSFWHKIADIEEKKRAWSLSNFFLFGWRPYLATGLMTFLIAAFLIFHGRPSPAPGPEEIVIAQHLELLTNLDIINHLDLLENWEAVKTLKEDS